MEDLNSGKMSFKVISSNQAKVVSYVEWEFADRRPVLNKKQSNFSLPPSTITPRNAQNDNIKQHRLFESFNPDRGVHALPIPNCKQNQTQIDSRILESSASILRKENQRYITVPNRPGDHTTNAGEASSSGFKNLMSAFNEAEEDLSGKDPIDDDIMNPDKQVYEAMLSDEETDEYAGHRGQYAWSVLDYSMVYPATSLLYC